MLGKFGWKLVSPSPFDGLWLYTYLTSQRGARLIISSGEKTANIERRATTVQRRMA